MQIFAVPENIALSDSGFIFLPSTGETFTLNEIGKQIFKLLQAKKSIEEIRNQILQEYDVDPITLERDIEDFILRLKSLNLVVQI
jgi:hypothetical protein